MNKQTKGAFARKEVKSERGEGSARAPTIVAIQLRLGLNLARDQGQHGKHCQHADEGPARRHLPTALLLLLLLLLLSTMAGSPFGTDVLPLSSPAAQGRLDKMALLPISPVSNITMKAPPAPLTHTFTLSHPHRPGWPDDFKQSTRVRARQKKSLPGHKSVV